MCLLFIKNTFKNMALISSDLRADGHVKANNKWVVVNLCQTKNHEFSRAFQ